MLSNPASLKPTKANAQLPSHCPKMGTKRQNNVKIEHKGKEFVLWAREMKDSRNHPLMFSQAHVPMAVSWMMGDCRTGQVVRTPRGYGKGPPARAQAVLMFTVGSPATRRSLWPRIGTAKQGLRTPTHSPCDRVPPEDECRLET